MGISRYFILAGLLHSCVGVANPSRPAYRPVTYATSNGEPIAVSDSTVFKLSSDGNSPSIVILDYGKDIEGYGTFQVIRKAGNTSVFETSYSETRALLDSYMVSEGWITRRTGLTS